MIQANIKAIQEGSTGVDPTSLSAFKTQIGAGAVNGATVSAAEYCDGFIHKTVLTCTATPIAITDDAGVAQYGGVKVYDFPAGLLFTLGAIVTGNLTAATPIIDNYDGDVSLGTVTATTGATLVSTEADILQSVAISAGASDKIAPVDAVTVATQLTESGARHIDGTATAADMYLNFVIDDNAAHVGSMSATFTGTITVWWMNLGDN